MDAYQWDYAYESLCESSRKEIGRLKFEVVIRVAKVPAAPDIPVYDLISRSILQHGEPEQEGGHARIKVIPDVRDSDGQLLLFRAWLFFVQEHDEWRFDLFETIRSIQGESPPAGDLSDR